MLFQCYYIKIYFISKLLLFLFAIAFEIFLSCSLIITLK